METWNHNVFVTWFPVSCCALNKWQMLLSPQGRQRTRWIINHKPFWVWREKQLNLFATSCINLQPSCWSVVQSIMSSRGWWVCSCIELWVELLWPCLFLDTFPPPHRTHLWGRWRQLQLFEMFLFLHGLRVSKACVWGYEEISSKSDHFMNGPGGYITRPAPDLPIRPLRTRAAYKNARTATCGRAQVLARSSMQRDEVVNLHVSVRCQDGRWELTLAQGESVACFRWMRISGCVVEGKIKSSTTKERCQMTLAWGKFGEVSWTETGSAAESEKEKQAAANRCMVPIQYCNDMLEFY